MSGWEHSSTKWNLSCAVRVPGGVNCKGNVHGFRFDIRRTVLDLRHHLPINPFQEIRKKKWFAEQNRSIPSELLNSARVFYTKRFGTEENMTGSDYENSAWPELSDCTLCPRECHVNRSAGKTGYCGQTARLTAARAALHFWEEPCLSGTNGSGAVFFSGCNLRCVYCQNHEIAQGQAGREITSARLSDIFLELQGKCAHNINLVTPAHFVPQIITALRTAKKQGLSIPVIYNTSAYEKPETLRMLEGLVDIYLPDLKYCDPDLSGRYSHAADYFDTAAAAIAEMVRQVGAPVFADGEDPLMRRGVIVRHLLLPGCGKDSRKVLRYLHETYKNDIYVSIMNQYTPLSHVSGISPLNRQVSGEEYNRIVDYAIRIGIENGFIQEGETCLESFIPAFDCEGI